MLSWEAGNWHKSWSQLDEFVLFCDQIYVPPSLHPKILFEYHDSPLAGHPGWAKTIELVGHDYAWPGMSNDIWHYVCSCDLCQWNKSSHHAPYGELIPLKTGNQFPWISSWTFWWILHAFDTLLVVVNQLSKQAHFIPTIKSLNAPNLAQLFISTVFFHSTLFQTKDQPLYPCSGAPLHLN